MSAPVFLEDKDSQEEQLRKLKSLFSDLYDKMDVIGGNVVDFNTTDILIQTVARAIESDD